MTNFERCTLDEVSAALSFIDAHDRELWVFMGMAVKNEFGSDGFDVWDTWSQSASNYKPDSARDTWKSFKLGGGITIASLFKEAINCDYTPEKRELSTAQKAELDRERERRQAKRQLEEAAEQELVERWHGVIARAAQQVWDLLSPTGNSPYLGAKKIKPFGARFVPHGIVIEFCDDVSVNVITGRDEIAAFFNRKTEETSFRYLKPGCLVLPMGTLDTRMMNLQVIYPSGKKAFLKHGRKSGCFFWLAQSADREIEYLVFAEGFATAASILMALDQPVVVVFDCGNMPTVAAALREYYPSMPFVFAADNDLGAEKGNPGVDKARESAALVGGSVWIPHPVQEAAA
ncbi:hypothetical protein G8770_03655 [Aestuariicella hydrocarbonica]|uniref:Primase C-terminal 2 domain-containing protein n=1 Tax=Pseudomaricurvus hydrocarbonicus TaxID=1470433 RepID=A0A9E5MGG6_9GAMM|nr:PriCT-2 domain-containing protein [Aestuariicella hydrocarbonica]NHO64641.1 hypothetical protein [Aestuariicella hydrocarbonica]